MALAGLLQLFNLSASTEGQNGVVTLLSAQNMGPFHSSSQHSPDETGYGPTEAGALANGPVFGLPLGKPQAGRLILFSLGP